MGDNDEVLRAWTGGGGWNDSPPDPVPEATPPKPREDSEDPDRDDGGDETKKKKEKDPDADLASHGVVAGRFLPPHAGHRYLIDFARLRTQSLSVFVVKDDGDAIPGVVRQRWLREMFPHERVAVLLVKASEVKRSPDAWASTFKRLAVSKRTADGAELVMFASDDHDGMDAEIAKVLGAELVMVDPKREVVPISGEEIRGDVMAKIEHVIPPARSHFVRRVAVVGPESSGKTTLARSLASAYRTVVVPERARFVAEQKGGSLDYDDMADIAAGQWASCEALLLQAHRLIFCDTNLRSIDLWSRRLFDRSPSWILEQAREHDHFDLVLIMAPDVPFVGASQRDQPGARRAFFESIVKVESTAVANVVIVQGSWDERERIARNAVDALLTSPTFLPARHQPPTSSRRRSSSSITSESNPRR